ncbi:MAG: hypothetical protein WCX31_03400 [Salinivirgaceae bacterium]
MVDRSWCWKSEAHIIALAKIMFKIFLFPLFIIANLVTDKDNSVISSQKIQMNKVKTTLAILLTSFCLLKSGKAQNEEVPKELKNAFSISTYGLSLNEMSVKYYRLVNNNIWLKAGLINVYGSSLKKEPSFGSFITKETTLSAGLTFGLEKHSALTDKFKIVYGMDIQMNYKYFNQFIDNPNWPPEMRNSIINEYRPGIGFVIGGYYQFSTHFSLGFEFNPTVSYYYKDYSSADDVNSYTVSGFEYSFKTNNALLSLKYTW